MGPCKQEPVEPVFIDPTPVQSTPTTKPSTAPGWAIALIIVLGIMFIVLIGTIVTLKVIAQ